MFIQSNQTRPHPDAVSFELYFSFLLFFFDPPNKIFFRALETSLSRSDNEGNDNGEEENVDDDYDDGLKSFLPKREHVPYNGIKHKLDESGRLFYQLANDRRSIRKFSTKKVDYEIIRKCIQAAGNTSYCSLVMEEISL